MGQLSTNTEFRSYAGKRILVVDDVMDNRIIVTHVLRRIGFDVATACNGEEALERIESEHFDLVIMDMQMPVMDGYTATKKLRELHTSLPVVAFTAHALQEDRRRCLEAGCRDHLTKPLQKELLYRVLAELC